MEIKGIGEIVPDYPIGALEEYYKLTGEDILFDNNPIDNPTKRSLFVFVGLKYGLPMDLVKTPKDIENISSKDFLNIFAECLKMYSKDFDVEEEEEDKPKKK